MTGRSSCPIPLVRALFSLLLVSLPLLPAFAASRADAVRAKQVFTYNNLHLPSTLDPGKAQGIYERQVLNQLFEGLTTQNPRDLAAQPGVAKTWSVSQGGTVYTFTLDKQAVWSDGHPLTANDFVFAWRRVLDPKFKSTYATQLYAVKNARAFHTGALKNANQVGVRAVGTHTLRVELENPTPYFLQLTAFFTLFPVPTHTVKKYGDGWTSPQHIVSNGPFALTEERKKEDLLVLKKNPRYPHADQVRLETIRVYGIEDSKKALQKYAKGILDFTGETPIPARDFPKWRFTPDFHSAPWFAVNYLRVNTSKPPFDNVNVRKAVSLAVDRKKVVAYVVPGGHIAAESMVPKGIPQYTPATLDGFDPQEARKLLAGAGYCVPQMKNKECKRFPKISILLHHHEAHMKLVLAIQQMLRKHLGIRNIHLDVAPSWGEYLRKVNAMDFNLARSGWTGDYFDPNTFLELWSKDHEQNNTGWTNETYDKLLARAAKETKASRRLAYLHQAEALLLKRLPIIPIYHYSKVYLMKPFVQNYADNLRQVLLLRDVYIDYYKNRD